jgi:hybrid cluster-associated redox disulfide protein
MPIDSQTDVDDVMRRFPATIHTFLAFKLRCVGCPISAFHTVREACLEHGVDEGVFLRALRRSANAGLGV